jgi:hypothetical protein
LNQGPGRDVVGILPGLYLLPQLLVPPEGEKIAGTGARAGA